MDSRPVWLRVRAPSAAEAAEMGAVRAVLEEQGLRTICQGARCPNVVECWSARTATFLLLGGTCTRACRFCAVPHASHGEELDPSEAERVAAAVERLGLRHVVLTSVDRDDLPDGGAAAIAEAVRAVKRASVGARVEVLMPDFGGNPRALSRVVSSGADVLGHNVETVRRLSPTMRDRRASYEGSLNVLCVPGSRRRGASGEERADARIGRGSGRDPRRAGRPAPGRRDVADARPVPCLRLVARPPCGGTCLPTSSTRSGARRVRLGFAHVASGPLVRSSYHAEAGVSGACDSSSI